MKNFPMRLLFSIAMLSAAVGPGLFGEPAPLRRPNILLIVSEDNGPELGCYGDPHAHTPNLDRLAHDGVRFAHAYVTQAGCSQSRSSILTGQYPHQNGQLGLATWGFRLYDGRTPNVARSLKEAGYRTGMIGKLHINPESAFPFDFRAMPAANFARKNLGNYARQAETFFNAGDAPFFLSINYPDAHIPWIRQVDGLPENPLSETDVTPPPYTGVNGAIIRANVADYYNCINRLDVLVGELLAALERSGQAGNTLVIYLGDHGADLPRGKRNSYEGGVRIPLILRWPGKARPGQVREELVSTIDLMPTMLAVAGAAPVAELPGASLAPLLQGASPEWRSHLFTEFHSHTARETFWPQRTVRNERFKLIENLRSGKANPVYDDTLNHFSKMDFQKSLASAPREIRAAYALMQTPPPWELYDLQADPWEFKNLANDAAYAGVLRDLQSELARWRRETRDPLLDPTNLSRLEAEMNAAPRGRSEWQYPHYFFSQRPPSTSVSHD